MMATGDWQDGENDAIVADYFDMLSMELAGQSFNKAERNRALQELIGRGRGSIEYKHQNISAILKGLGETWIEGYKPAFNFQRSLEKAVIRWLADHPHWVARAPFAERVDGMAESAPLWIGPAPTLSNAPEPAELEQTMAIARRYDVAERDERNRALGRAGDRASPDRHRPRLHGRGDLPAARADGLRAAAHRTPDVGTEEAMNAPVLQLRDLGVSFGGIRAVDGVSFDVAPNSITTVIGPNGAGKSTLFNLISGSVPAHRGEVVFEGVPHRQMRPSQLQKLGVGRSFQITNLFFELTVAENLRLGAQLLEPVGRWFARSGAARSRAPASRSCWPASGSGTRQTSARATSPMASSGGSRSRWRWRRGRSSCCSTSPRRA